MSIKVEIQEQRILQLYLSIALGGNSYLHPYIDECYRKKEWDYYEAYQSSGLKDEPLFSMYSTKNEEKIRQVAGIIEWSRENQEFSQIDHLIKKGYKFVYQYLQQHQQIDFEHFTRSYAKRHKSKGIKEIELIYQNIILWYLCERENKPFDTGSVTWQSFQEVLFASSNEIEIQKVMFSEKMLVKYKKEIEDFYFQYNIPRNANFDSLGAFLEYLICDQIKRMNETIPNLPIEKAELKVFQVSPTRYIGALGGWLKTLQIHELDATEQVPLAKVDLDMVFLELLYARKYNYITEEDQDLFFITCLYQKCLSFLYRETKQLYLDQSKQDYYLSMKAKESRINEQEADLLRKQQEWQFTYKRQLKEVEGLTRSLREANARIRQLEQQIENMDDYTEEVYALRNFVYREEKADNNAPSLNTMNEYIRSMKIIIIGGSLTWQQKLKDVFPTIEFFEVDEKNRDISKIKRVDAVFINTTIFAHSFYKKVMKELSKKETPLIYLSGQNNIEKTTLEIYQWLTE